MWNGWADSGTSPYNPLNYWAAARKQMGDQALSKFLKLYMIPGVGHCNNGFNVTQHDMLSPLLDWAEKDVAPNKVTVDFLDPGKPGTILNSRPVYPYPSIVSYSGSGDINAASSWVRADLPTGLNDVLDFLGLANYVPGKQMWCEVVNGAPVCTQK
jgi:feruloyl esterase